MLSRRNPLFVVLLFCTTPDMVNAQVGRHAVTVGGAGHIGFLWQLSDGFALRPDFSVGRTHSTAANVERTTTITTIGLSGLFSRFQVDSSLVGYLAPRVGVQMTNISGSIPLLTGRDEDYFAELRLGLRQALSRRLALFGESGLRYSWSSANDNDVWSLSTSSSLGIQLYFR